MHEASNFEQYWSPYIKTKAFLEDFDFSFLTVA
jgi:hypothetical protein